MVLIAVYHCYAATLHRVILTGFNNGNTDSHVPVILTVIDIAV
jgi:hypothetical protein